MTQTKCKICKRNNRKEICNYCVETKPKEGQRAVIGWFFKDWKRAVVFATKKKMRIINFGKDYLVLPESELKELAK